jgi:hypothetical protein
MVALASLFALSKDLVRCLSTAEDRLRQPLEAQTDPGQFGHPRWAARTVPGGRVSKARQASTTLT